MCIVSMVFDEYGKTPIQPWIQTPWIQTVTTTPAVKPETPLDLFERLVEVAERLDQALGLPNCEDPAKLAWLEKVRAAIREHAAQETERRLSGK
jgi:hypothetical protein